MAKIDPQKWPLLWHQKWSILDPHRRACTQKSLPVKSESFFGAFNSDGGGSILTPLGLKNGQNGTFSTFLVISESQLEKWWGENSVKLTKRGLWGGPKWGPKGTGFGHFWGTLKSDLVILMPNALGDMGHGGQKGQKKGVFWTKINI